MKRKIRRRIKKELVVVRERMKNGRGLVCLEDGSIIKRSYYVWNKHFPNDPIVKGNGEIIHHVDEIKSNDDIDNLQKMSDADHRSLHSHIGVAALTKWRKDHPKKMRKQSRKNAFKLQRKINDDSEFATELKQKRRKGIIKANKLRKGEKRSKEFCKEKSEFWKEWWRDPENRKKNKGKSKFSKEQIIKIKRLFNKMSLQKIADKFNVAYSTIYSIKTHKTYKETINGRAIGHNSFL